jgi:hypothetical protein
MTLEEELKTAYANLKGHQERSLQYIKDIDELQLEISALREENRRLQTLTQSTHPKGS